MAIITALYSVKETLKVHVAAVLASAYTTHILTQNSYIDIQSIHFKYPFGFCFCQFHASLHMSSRDFSVFQQKISSALFALA